MGFWTPAALAMWGPNALPRPQFTVMLMRTCPLCNGTGLNPKLLTYVCPKCQGEKKVPR